MIAARVFLIGLAALATAGAAQAGTDGYAPYAPFQKFAPLQHPPQAERFRPYKGYSAYGGDPTNLSPRARPYQSNAPGGFRRPIRDEDSDRGTMKRQGGTFGR